jgi:hypothetical protein
MVKLKILCYIPRKMQKIAYTTYNKNRSIQCPICGRWYAEYYIRQHLRQIHEIYVFKIEEVR